jgi:hypothetical protein
LPRTVEWYQRAQGADVGVPGARHLAAQPGQDAFVEDRAQRPLELRRDRAHQPPAELLHLVPRPVGDVTEGVGHRIVDIAPEAAPHGRLFDGAGLLPVLRDVRQLVCQQVAAGWLGRRKAPVIEGDVLAERKGVRADGFVELRRLTVRVDAHARQVHAEACFHVPARRLRQRLAACLQRQQTLLDRFRQQRVFVRRLGRAAATGGQRPADGGGTRRWRCRRGTARRRRLADALGDAVGLLFRLIVSPAEPELRPQRLRHRAAAGGLSLSGRAGRDGATRLAAAALARMVRAGCLAGRLLDQRRGLHDGSSGAGEHAAQFAQHRRRGL